MSIILPTFEDREKLTAGKLNQFRDAVESKFSAITGADLAWPLVAEDNIDMASSFTFIGLRTLWNIINAGDYTLDATGFQAAITAAAGGGCVLIPPNTEISCDGIDLATDDVLILGCGASSVLKLTTGSTSGYMIQSAASAHTNLSIMNLTLDGQSTGTAQDGIVMQYVEGFTMRDVIVKNFTGDAIVLTSDSAGNSCTNVVLDNIKCSGGGAAHILADDVNFLTISNVQCVDAGAAAIDIEPSAAAALVKNVQLSNVVVDGTTGIGISIVGFAAGASDNHSIIKVSDCTSIGGSDDAFRIGFTSKMLKHVTMYGCTGHAATNNGLTTNATKGVISGNYFADATDDGIDLVSSDELVVTLNNCRDAAGDYGIDADGTTSCSIHENDVTGANTQGILLTNATTPILGPNQGFTGPTLNTVISDYPHETRTATGTYATTYTIPAYSVKAGDHIRITVYHDITSFGSGTIAVTTRIGGQSLGGISAIAAVGLLKTVIDIHLESTGAASNLQHSTISLSVPNTPGTPGAFALTQTLTQDFTADSTVDTTVAITGAATVYLEEVLIEWLGGNE